MKMERLIGILSILLQRDKVTAPELAEQFEVSRRTIQRDIESLCQAGIPHCHCPGHWRRHLDSGGIPGGPDGPHHPRDAGHPGGAAKPGQRQRHPPLCPADGKAFSWERAAGIPTF